MKYSAILTALCCGLLAVAAEKPNILICTDPSLPPEVASAARELLKLENARPLAALAACGAGEKAEAAESVSLLPDSAFNRAAFNHLVVIGRPDRDPLQAKVRGHQAKVDPADREFYRLGYGRMRGDIGYVECDWNPFLYSEKVKNNPFTTVVVKISGTSDAGVLAALNAFREGLLNGVVAVGTPERPETSLLDYLPSPVPPPVFPDRIGPLTLAGYTQPDGVEYRAWLEWGGAEPKQLWRIKYLADGVYNDVSPAAWVNGLHRLAYGNAVTLAEFETPEAAKRVKEALMKRRGAKAGKMGGLDAVVFDQPTDEAFDRSYGKVAYVTRGRHVAAVSLPENEWPAAAEALRRLP